MAIIENEGGSHGDTPSQEVEPLGHWHVFLPKRLRFHVNDPESGVPIADVELRVSIGEPGGVSLDLVAEMPRPREALYSLDFTPAAIGPYALVASADLRGRLVRSAPVPFEVVRDGEEGIRADANGTSYVYQIRYNWEPVPLVADDAEPVRLIFELMRGIPEGEAIEWRLPYRNPFDHIAKAEAATVTVISEDGDVQEVLAPRYRGMGVYEAKRVFARSEVDEGRTYAVKFSFVDPYNGCAVTNAKAYRLRLEGRGEGVGPAHGHQSARPRTS